MDRDKRPPTSATGANWSAHEGDERRGYGAARGAKKSKPVIPEHEQCGDTDRIFWNNQLKTSTPGGA